MKTTTLIAIAAGVYFLTRTKEAAPTGASASDSAPTHSDSWLSDLAGGTVGGWIDDLFGGSDTAADAGTPVGDNGNGFGGTPDLGDYSLTPPVFE